jgi:hypothetical protein
VSDETRTLKEHETMTRDEHVEWSKQRALEYLPGDPQQAFTSMASDLGKHPETEGHPAIELGMMMLMSGMLDDPAKMREFIVGFH